MIHPELVILGGGNMGSALLRGALAQSLCDPTQVLIIEPDPARRADLALLGVEVQDSARGASQRLGPATTLLLAVKPQVFPQAASDLGGVGEIRVVSIMAGLQSASIQRALGGRARVVRMMPNLGVLIGQGVTAVAGGTTASPADLAWGEQLAKATGICVKLDESLFDAFTALAGSGPAYLFYLAEAMTRAGTELGIAPAEADRIVRGTLAGGAGLLVQRTDRSAGDWRASVTSRGGTTEAAVGVLEAQGVGAALVEAVLAGAARGAALARGE